MTRRTLLSAFAAIFAMAVTMFVAGAGTASAQQNPNCCTYKVIRANFTNTCNSIRVATRWDCAGTPVSYVKSYTGNGTTIEPIGPPFLPPCPPACQLLQVSLDNVNFIGPNQSFQYNFGVCCFLLEFVYDVNGCIEIKVTRVTC